MARPQNFQAVLGLPSPNSDPDIGALLGGTAKKVPGTLSGEASKIFRAYDFPGPKNLFENPGQKLLAGCQHVYQTFLGLKLFDAGQFSDM